MQVFHVERSLKLGNDPELKRLRKQTALLILQKWQWTSAGKSGKLSGENRFDPNRINDNVFQRLATSGVKQVPKVRAQASLSEIYSSAAYKVAGDVGELRF